MSRPNRQNQAGRVYLDLQNRARREKRGTQELLTLYVVERWLARLARSEYVEDFVLKGGMLLAAFGQRRPTVDADALARNLARDTAAVAARVAAIAAQTDAEDGVEFLTDTVKTSVIRDDALYSGVRVVMDARIATAAVKLRVDVNFGDPVTPAARLIQLPSLRPESPVIRVLGYPVETVLAEKLSTAITLGAASTRVRDYADIYTLAATQPLNHGEVRAALLATARFRETTLQPLSSAVGNLVELRAGAYLAYRNGLGRDGMHLPSGLDEVLATVVAFADPLMADDPAAGDWDPVLRTWTAPVRRADLPG
jgi:hypothetical protein